MFLKTTSVLYEITHLTHQVYNAPAWDYALDWKKKKKQKCYDLTDQFGKEIFLDLIFPAICVTVTLCRKQQDKLPSEVDV